MAINGENWCDNLQTPNENWEHQLAQIPVVRLSYSDGGSCLAIVQPVVQEKVKGKVRKVTSLNLEVGQDGQDRMYMDVPVDNLRRGELNSAQGKPSIRVTFVGVAADPDFVGMKWSYVD